ncbi:MAG TPA: hypothetical protein VK563_12720 [Puia sp.]|nr:hypothetical protein [Puia sp.]
MKSHLSKLAIIAFLSLGFGLSASAQIYVNVRPGFTRVEHRPPAPSRGHVWVDEDWAYRDGHYVSTGGHWVAPPRPGMVWVAGRWGHTRRGYQWTAGRWKRR